MPRRSYLVQATAAQLAEQRDSVETRLREAAPQFDAEIVSVSESRDHDLTVHVRIDAETQEDAEGRVVGLGAVADPSTAWWILSSTEEQQTG